MGVAVGSGVGDDVGDGGITTAVGDSVAAGSAERPKLGKLLRPEQASKSRHNTRKMRYSRIFMAATITQA